MFASPAIAAAKVAGLPAAARAAREASLAGADEIVVLVEGGWTPAPAVRAEIERLTAPARLAIRGGQDAAALAPGDLAILGERQFSAERLSAAWAGAPFPGMVVVGGGGFDAQAARRLGDGGGAAALARAAQRIVKATAKPQDGIISRAINRPISQAISAFLLRWPAIRPGHATFLNALIALAMGIALAFGDEAGLVAGAVLFQVASIVDGVDGEIARATFRTSNEGARLDSLIDAATNLAFLAGVSWNVYLRGEVVAAAAGTLSLLLLFTGLWLISRAARRSSAGFTFNAVKDHFRERPSRLMTWLTWLTMRDFFALVVSVAIVAGFAHVALIGFAIVAAGWLVVVVSVMARQAA